MKNEKRGVEGGGATLEFTGRMPRRVQSSLDLSSSLLDTIVVTCCNT